MRKLTQSTKRGMSKRRKNTTASHTFSCRNVFGGSDGDSESDLEADDVDVQETDRNFHARKDKNLDFVQKEIVEKEIVENQIVENEIVERDIQPVTDYSQDNFKPQTDQNPKNTKVTHSIELSSDDEEETIERSPLRENPESEKIITEEFYDGNEQLSFKKIGAHRKGRMVEQKYGVKLNLNAINSKITVSGKQSRVKLALEFMKNLEFQKTNNFSWHNNSEMPKTTNEILHWTLSNTEQKKNGEEKWKFYDEYEEISVEKTPVEKIGEHEYLKEYSKDKNEKAFIIAKTHRERTGDKQYEKQKSKLTKLAEKFNQSGKNHQNHPNAKSVKVLNTNSIEPKVTLQMLAKSKQLAKNAIRYLVSVRGFSSELEFSRLHLFFEQFDTIINIELKFPVLGLKKASKAAYQNYKKSQLSNSIIWLTFTNQNEANSCAHQLNNDDLSEAIFDQPASTIVSKSIGKMKDKTRMSSYSALKTENLIFQKKG